VHYEKSNLEGSELMTNREKRPKMVFRKFLEDNQKKMDDYMTHLEFEEKYEREPWMLGSDPEKVVTPETIVEMNQLGDG
jgi:hypothetical protein